MQNLHDATKFNEKNVVITKIDEDENIESLINEDSKSISEFN